MSRKFFLIVFFTLSLGLLGITTHATAQVTVSINPMAENCVFNNTGTCAYAPNPVALCYCDFVVWSNATGTAPHTATSDDNSFDTGLIAPGASSSAIGPFSVAPNQFQTKTYHCSLHPATMGGTLLIKGETVTTTTRTTSPPTTSTTTTTTTTSTTTTTTTTTIRPTTTTSTTSTTFPTQRPCGLGASVSIGPVSTLTPGTSSMIGVNVSTAPNAPFTSMEASLSMSDNGAGGIINPSSFVGNFLTPNKIFSVSYTPPKSSPPSITLSVSGTVSFLPGGGCLGTSYNVSSAQTFPVEECKDKHGKDKENCKNKHKGHDKDKN